MEEEKLNEKNNEIPKNIKTITIDDNFEIS